MVFLLESCRLLPPLLTLDSPAKGFKIGFQFFVISDGDDLCKRRDVAGMQQAFELRADPLDESQVVGLRLRNRRSNTLT